MVDMVVHRHKIRETLSRICRLLMRAPALKHAEHGTRKLNGGSHYANGSRVDASLIDTRTGSAPAIEAEILGPEERFDTARIEQRDKTRGDDDTPPTRSLSKDRQH
jgi:acetyl-CoA carboxylase carboxyl transferase subunit beta